MNTSRREFAAQVAAGLGTFFGGRALMAQQAAPQTMTGPMNQSAHRPVRLPPKAGATPSMDAKARDAVEHKLKCGCPCPLDVYTCRTTDVTCPVSPAMHRDVVALIDGGYTEPEILKAFEDVYGERVHMAPKPEGFNLLAYVMPYIALGGAAVAAALIVRRWMRQPAPVQDIPRPKNVDATADELARVREAVRSGDE